MHYCASYIPIQYNISIYAKHRKELVKFQHLLITYNPLDETTSKKQTNKKKKKLVGEDIFFLPIWFYICNIVYKLQHSIFPRKKEIYIQNAIVCQNWKFETALECAYQLSIYLGMSTSTYEQPIIQQYEVSNFYFLNVDLI